MMDEATRAIQADFDRLALLSESGWDQNSQYDKFLLQHIPPHCENALEIGCGLGDFSRQLAARSKNVLALDLSPNMIRLAKARSTQFANKAVFVRRVKSGGPGSSMDEKTLI